MTEETTVRCPGCNRSQPMRGPDSLYWCTRCSAMFDDDPDEGGDFYDDPVKSVEAKERQNGRKVR